MAVYLHKGTGYSSYWPLARWYVTWRAAHSPGMPGIFPLPPRVSDPDMHHGTCVTNVPWCMPRSLTYGFLWSRWWGKRSRHSRRMRNPRNFAYLVRGPLAVSIHTDTRRMNINQPHGFLSADITGSRWHISGVLVALTLHCRTTLYCVKQDAQYHKYAKEIV